MRLMKARSSFPSVNSFPLQKCRNPNKVSFLANEIRKPSIRNVSARISATYIGSSFGIPSRVLRHPLEAELPLMEVSDGGIGIADFFHGKNIFITGATGLVGKVLVEKLLRSTPVGKIYVLIKAKDKEEASDRLNKEIINSDLFESLKGIHGRYYESFVREKVIPVVGNICEINLGMDNESAAEIMKEVDVIIESAASTTLNERYDLLIDLNTNAPQRLMRFAKSCKNLKLFTHISTAYVHGRREGLLMERPLIMGENVRDASDSSLPPLDLGDEIRIAADSSVQNVDATKNLKRLGQERAEHYGWFNAYHMTKAMGEMVINEIKEDVACLIIRPAVIESCFKEPFPGWIQGNRMYDPVILSYGKGQLPAYLADPQVSMDIIPVDMVVNTIIAAVAKHGTMERPQLNVYHVGSATRNPLKFGEFFDIIHEYFASNPSINGASSVVRPTRFFNNFDDFSRYTRDEIWGRHVMNGLERDEKIVQKQRKANVAYAEQLCKMYEFVGFIKGRFDVGNTEKLLKEMSEEELMNFEVDVMNINWRKYFQESHIPGLLKHVISNRRKTCV